jgi:hypothetical protein
LDGTDPFPKDCKRALFVAAWTFLGKTQQRSQSAEDWCMETTQRQRLILGIAAVAVVAGLCFAAVWSVRGRLQPAPAPVALASPDPALVSENARLRAEVAHLTAERNAALAQKRQPVAPVVQPPADTAAPAESARPSKLAKPQRPSGSDGFSEPQTFDSISTSN